MPFKPLLVTEDSLVLELRSGQPWRSEPAHALSLDGVALAGRHENLLVLRELEPDRGYRLAIGEGAQRVELELRTEPRRVQVDVREFGAVGDGVHDDTGALQAAIAACPGNGRVVVPAGTWLSAPLFLKTGLHLRLDRGATVLGHPDMARWPTLPAQLDDGHGGQRRVLGSWEGRPARCHASLLTGIGVERVVIDGEGVVDGNASFATWWGRPKAPFPGGWRPRTLLLVGASQVAVAGIGLRNSPSWTVHALACHDLLFAGLDIRAPVDSPNTDGIDPESCLRVRIIGCRIDTGDDCVAIKSGKPGPDGPPPPSRATLVSNCLMRSGHGAVVIGSETAGGVYDVLARDCLFEGTDRGLRIKTRRGRGRAAVVDGVRLENTTMAGVGTPLSINSFYWCDPDGREPHVGDRAARPVDEGTPSIRDIAVVDVDCRGVRHAAAWVLGLPEQPIEGLRIDHFTVRFDPAAEPACPDMAEGIAPVARHGLYLENVRGLALGGIDIEGAQGPVLTQENVA